MFSDKPKAITLNRFQTLKLGKQFENHFIRFYEDLRYYLNPRVPIPQTSRTYDSIVTKQGDNVLKTFIGGDNLLFISSVYEGETTQHCFNNPNIIKHKTTEKFEIFVIRHENNNYIIDHHGMCYITVCVDNNKTPHEIIHFVRAENCN